MDWIARLRPPRYLRYFFYILFMWYQKVSFQKEDAPIIAVVLLSIPHAFLLIFFLPTVLGGGHFPKVEKAPVVVAYLLCFGVHYAVFLSKDKWKKYLEEFKYLTITDRRNGTLLVLFYVFFSVFISTYPIWLYVIFDIDLRK